MSSGYQEFLPTEDIQQIHQTSMKLLENVGIEFPYEEALTVFRKHGVKTEGSRVYPTESQVMKAIATAPKQFTIHARNPERSVVVGEGARPAFAPGPGSSQT